MDTYETLLKTRLDYVEEQLAILFPDRYVSYAQSVGMEMPSEVIALVRAGKKIAAIELYRKQTGLGLKEAKQVIDSL